MRPTDLKSLAIAERSRIGWSTPLNLTLRDRSGFQLRALADDEVELLIFDVIGRTWDESGVRAQKVADELKAAGDISTIQVRINSPGGDVFEALAIYNTLVRHSARVIVTVDGMALSSASAIAMAGDEILMAENAMMMIHEAWTWAAGTAEDLRKAAETLDKSNDTLAKTYAARSGMDRERVRQLMAEETWFDAEETVDAGLADGVIDAKRVAACFDLSRFRNVPETLRIKNKTVGQGRAAEAPRKKETPKMPENTTQDKPKDSPTAEAIHAAQRVAAPQADAPPPPRGATVAELKSALPDSDAAFREECIEGGLTLAAAKDRWMDRLRSQVAEHGKKMAELQAAGARSRGVDPLPTRSTADVATGSAAARWDEAVGEKVRAGLSRHEAIKRVGRENPDLRAEYVAEYNATHGR
ncbi:MAG: head maturation protease, ClpP-related [Phycisphaerae bacterium]